MTRRRVTSSEKRFWESRSALVRSCPAEYVADAPFVFSNRIQVTSALSRIEFFKMAMDIPGAIIECGVYQGNSLMLYLHLSTILEPYAINRSIVGFDTFEGFRSLSSEFDPSDVHEGMFSDARDDVLQQAIDLVDIVRPVASIPRCEIVKGDIVETVPAFVKERPDLVVAMLILDTDLYESTKSALQHFYPLMPKNGIVVLDEVCYRNFAGETVALKEIVGVESIELKRLPFDSSVGYFRKP